MCGNMLLAGSVLWSMCFARQTRKCKPCRRCGARRVLAAVRRPRRCQRSATALSLLLLFPLLGMAVAAPEAAAVVLLAPLFLASVLRCWCLKIAVFQWQAWHWQPGFDVSLSTVCQRYRLMFSTYLTFSVSLFTLCFSASIVISIAHTVVKYPQCLRAVAGHVMASCGVLGHLASAVATRDLRHIH